MGFAQLSRGFRLPTRNPGGSKLHGHLTTHSNVSLWLQKEVASLASISLMWQQKVWREEATPLQVQWEWQLDISVPCCQCT